MIFVTSFLLSVTVLGMLGIVATWNAYLARKLGPRH